MSATSSRPWLASYAPGVPADIDLPDESLTDMLDGAVDRFPDLVALDFYGATTTYRQLGDQVSRAAQALRDLGVGAGDPPAGGGGYSKATDELQREWRIPEDY